MQTYDLIVIGAGPAGLSCAAEAQKAGLSCLVLDKGGVADTIRRFPVNMIFFSTPELIEIAGIPFTTQNLRPTRVEALNYYRLVADRLELDLRLHTRVTGLRRVDHDGVGRFEVVTQGRSGKPEETLQARAVVLAIGYYDIPNYLGVPGENLPHVFHYYTEPFEYSRSHVLVVGGGNNAAEAALDLYRHGADVTLVHRRPALKPSVKYWIRPDLENRIQDGKIQAHYRTRVDAIEPGKVWLAPHSLNDAQETGDVSSRDERFAVEADYVFILTGYIPDMTLMRDVGVRLIEGTLAPQLDASTYESTVPGLFVAGSCGCGIDTGSIFIENARMHAAPIVRRVRGLLS